MSIVSFRGQFLRKQSSSTYSFRRWEKVAVNSATSTNLAVVIYRHSDSHSVKIFSQNFPYRIVYRHSTIKTSNQYTDGLLLGPTWHL